MTVTVHKIAGQSPFNPVTSFTALACGMERITPKASTMDLQLAIDKSRKLNEALLCAKGAQMTGGDSAPIIADAVARLAEVANALGHFADPIDAATAPTDEHDEAAMAAVEMRQEFRHAAE